MVNYISSSWVYPSWKKQHRTGPIRSIQNIPQQQYIPSPLQHHEYQHPRFGKSSSDFSFQNSLCKSVHFVTFLAPSRGGPTKTSKTFQKLQKISCDICGSISWREPIVWSVGGCVEISIPYQFIPTYGELHFLFLGLPILEKTTQNWPHQIHTKHTRATIHPQSPPASWVSPS